MRELLERYVTLCSLVISLLLLNPIMVAAETIMSTGHSFITSSVNKDIFRTRAVENALQKIVLASGQDLNSFSIVENGKVLLDQIQTRSAVKVLQYEVIEESVKNNNYHVTIEAVLGQDSNEGNNRNCKKASVKSIDFLLNIKRNNNDFPAWASISKNWILNELENHSLHQELKIAPTSLSKTVDTNSYTLFDQKKLPVGTNNIYKMDTQIFFERENKNNLLEKKIILLAKIKTKIMRKNVVFSELEFNQPYVIHNKLFNNAFLGTTRSDWEKIKKNFSELLKDRIHKQAASLNCVNVDPRVFSKAGVPFIDFGHLDGIEKSDMFVIKSSSAKKTYLKIVEIKDHETEVEIISQQENMASINGKIVELVVGS